jgi:hypothetical protein
MDIIRTQDIKVGATRKLQGIRPGFPSYLWEKRTKVWDLPKPELLKKADIFLVSKSDTWYSEFLSYMVCTVTRSPFSHSAIYIGDIKNDGDIMMEKIVAKIKETENEKMFVLSKELKVLRLKRLMSKMEIWMRTGENIHILEEANTNGVELVDAAMYYDNKKYGGIVKRIKNISVIDAEEIVDNAMADLGNGYDYIQFASLGYLYLTGKGKTEEASNLNELRVCSEVIVKAVAKKGLLFSKQIPTSNITPGDIDMSEIVETVPGMKNGQA